MATKLSAKMFDKPTNMCPGTDGGGKEEKGGYKNKSPRDK
jgi:hypothetical protein